MLEDIRFMSDWDVYDVLSINSNAKRAGENSNANMKTLHEAIIVTCPTVPAKF